MASRLLDRERFYRLWPRLGAADGGAEAFERLVTAYAEPHRVYHTAEHISDCLDQLDEAAIEPPVAVEAAIWFHDAVYDSHRDDNEARSAALAERILSEARGSAAVTHEVCRLVLLTRHADTPSDPAGGLICDVDLSILGRPPTQFEEFERRIGAEYAWVPDAQYREGRSRILSRLLSRPILYQTRHFRDRYEEGARRNLRNALAVLAR